VTSAITRDPTHGDNADLSDRVRDAIVDALIAPAPDA
jgi:hypothetical protein